MKTKFFRVFPDISADTAEMPPVYHQLDNSYDNYKTDTNSESIYIFLSGLYQERSYHEHRFHRTQQ